MEKKLRDPELQLLDNELADMQLKASAGATSLRSWIAKTRVYVGATYPAQLSGFDSAAKEPLWAEFPIVTPVDRMLGGISGTMRQEAQISQTHEKNISLLRNWITGLRGAIHGIDRYARSSPSTAGIPHSPPSHRLLRGSMKFIKVFISHSAGDKALAKGLVECIEACISVPDKAIRCTSVPGYKLAPGAVSDDELRDNLEECQVVIGLLTEKSLKSGYVIMELGAAWGLKKTTCALLAPTVDFKRIPGPLSRKHAIRIDSDHDIASLMEVIADATELPLTNRAKMTAAIGAFVKVVKSLQEDDSKTSRRRAAVTSVSPTAVSDSDAKNMMLTWFEDLSDQDKRRAIRYSEADSRLRLPTGTAKRLLKDAVSEHYVPRNDGDETVIFKRRPIRQQDYIERAQRRGGI